MIVLPYLLEKEPPPLPPNLALPHIRTKVLQSISDDSDITLSNFSVSTLFQTKMAQEFTIPPPSPPAPPLPTHTPETH